MMRTQLTSIPKTNEAVVVEKNSSHTNKNINDKVNKIMKAKIKYNKKAESEFFVDNSALAGFTGERILYMAVRELIENALDSCETHHILPDISISLKIYDQENDLWIISCQDNGIGIPQEKVPEAVCSFLTSGKYIEKQQRGLFGVGLKMIAAFSTKDTDNPIRVWSKSADEANEYFFELRTDIGTNKPIVLSKKNTANSRDSKIKERHGFRIETVLRARLPPVTKNKIYDYISQTSIINPYANLTFESDDGKINFERRTTVMPNPAREVLPHPAEMDLQTLKKAISNFVNQRITLQGVLSNSFQKLSSDKAKEIISLSKIETKSADKYNEHELINVVNVCKNMRFQSPNTDHLSPINQEIMTTGITSEYVIVVNKEISSNNADKTQENRNLIQTKILKPALTSYSQRTCVVNNRPMIIECGIAYGGDISSFKLFRFANKIPLLYDEGSDVAREVVSEVEINKMGITKKEVKEQFFNPQVKTDRTVELLPLHIFFHICSTKIPYKTAGKESIASEGEMKKYMKACLSDLYRKVSAQIRKELKMKDTENRLRLYKHYIPLIVDAISDSINVDKKKLSDSFTSLVEKHVKKEDFSDDNNHIYEVSEIDNKNTYKNSAAKFEIKNDKISTSKKKVRQNKNINKTDVKQQGQTTMDGFNKKGKRQV
ncbi:MAG: DNA topoisomerase VI subunit B [Nitrososphaeraceae archaeon]|nr:DNA topoisomerase VI subunit B [Nitrososphaeraceae archaeon]